MTEVRFDFPIAPADLSFEEIRQFGQEAETLGYEIISVGDHLVREQPLFEQWTTLAFIASCTDTIKIGSLITNPAFRSPVLLAKIGATVDHMSDGRLLRDCGGREPAARVHRDWVRVSGTIGPDRSDGRSGDIAKDSLEQGRYFV